MASSYSPQAGFPAAPLASLASGSGPASSSSNYIDHPVDAVFIGTTQAANSLESHGTGYALRLTRDTSCMDDLEVKVIQTYRNGRRCQDNNVVIKIDVEDIWSVAIHVPEATGVGDPETPSFVALATPDNTMRYTGFNKTIASYVPDIDECRRRNHRTAPDVTCLPYILIVLHKSANAEDHSNLAVSALE